MNQLLTKAQAAALVAFINDMRPTTINTLVMGVKITLYGGVLRLEGSQGNGQAYPSLTLFAQAYGVAV